MDPHIHTVSIDEFNKMLAVMHNSYWALKGEYDILNAKCNEYLKTISDLENKIITINAEYDKLKKELQHIYCD